MGWLGASGSSALTGARWSAGALWADSGSPAGSDSDWEDPADWPRSLPGTAEPIAFAVYIEGVDFTTYGSAASWSYGGEALMPLGIATSSASITLNEDAPDVAVGERVVVLTDTDVLWVGRVEAVDDDETPGMPLGTTLSCVDDLNRGSLTDVTVPLQGSPLEPTWESAPALVEYLLKRAGVPVVWTDDVFDTAEAGHDTAYINGFHTGSPIGLLGACLRYGGLVGSYTPAGLLVRSPGLYVMDTADIVVEDCQDQAASWRTQTRVSDVVTEFDVGTYTALEGDAGGLITRYRNVKDYGRRRFETTDFDEWTPWPQQTDNQAGMNVLLAGMLDDPPTRIEASYAILDTDDQAHAAWPFDHMRQDALDYMALRVAHDVSVDAWRVTIAGVQVTETDDWGDLYDPA